MADSAEQKARDMLERAGVYSAQAFTAGDLVEVANLISEAARLKTALRWEQNLAERIGTHGPGCWKWGPTHYECALNLIAEMAPLIESCPANDGIDEWAARRAP